jgi:hypothetical protein
MGSFPLPTSVIAYGPRFSLAELILRLYLCLFGGLLPYTGALKGVHPNLGSERYFRGPIGALIVRCPWVRCRAPPGPHGLLESI